MADVNMLTTENGWAKAWYGQDVHCVIVCEPPRGKWVIDTAYGIGLRAQGSGNAAGPMPDNYRAEITSTAELKGDFNIFEELQAIVDTYTGAVNWTEYDAVGGGEEPTTYQDGGYYKVKDGPDELEKWHIVLLDEELHQKTVDFFMYTRGKQYMYAQASPRLIVNDIVVDFGSEDTSMETEFSQIMTDDEGESYSGWGGTLTSYYYDEQKNDWIPIHIHRLPSGVVR